MQKKFKTDSIRMRRMNMSKYYFVRYFVDVKSVYTTNYPYVARIRAT